MKILKKASWKSIVFWIVAATLVFSFFYALVQFCNAQPGLTSDIEFDKLKSDYLLMMLQCFLGMTLILLPSLIERRLQVDVPDFMEIVFFVFLYASIYLGEIRSFYYRVPNWDLILHTFSGLMLGALGFSVVNILNRNNRISLRLSPVFVSLFAFCFALSMGVLWEIFEFSADGLMGLNMQKFALENGTLLVGRLAVKDTMGDLIVDACGALVISLAGFVSLKYKKGWIEKFFFRKIKKTARRKKDAA